ncbi:DUF411 domain-containing protein [Phaeobacter sp. JH20_36]|uniref:DUF411 domain-containing protein n=1 Tax=unclassified Phaeobacter TaxID=2621772 RepID=UPI003A83B17B
MNRRAFLLAAATLPLATTPLVAATATNDPVIKVMKSPSCGCCTGWVEHLTAASLKTEVRNIPDDQLWEMKSRLGISDDLASCHTATLGPYVIEGHVPASDIKRLLTERPDALGLTVPGMPIGSPGMEMGDSKEPFSTLLIRADGSTEAFAQHG